MHKNRVITERAVPLSLCFLDFSGDKGTITSALPSTSMDAVLAYGLDAGDLFAKSIEKLTVHGTPAGEFMAINNGSKTGLGK
ncbi:hypothetical protein [Paenibacillus radicis (ex Xue et al. 2023)]|uniref:Uncharacterized protein n=1 Tax=Paenibacillus radicis (ex Xue et al. 2023) TaxID=2972489 RepID=A0ABT1YUB3_9BACL|nr:hypothetical protein [Paenibacillus radicis (ex Xue et al. 2023)]MCR8636365.1 hypothetical protein [Paenibacillus radicis (ex Xue et al. 2023)]